MDLFRDVIRSPVTGSYYVKRLMVFVNRLGSEPDAFVVKGKGEEVPTDVERVGGKTSQAEKKVLEGFSPGRYCGSVI